MPSIIRGPQGQEFDVTPEIMYQDGKAVKVVEHTVLNLTAEGISEYGITPEGKYTEWHFDPEHGGFLKPQEVPKSRLVELAEANPDTIPGHEVLGKTREEVEALLGKLNIEAYHKDK